MSDRLRQRLVNDRQGKDRDKIREGGGIGCGLGWVLGYFSYFSFFSLCLTGNVRLRRLHQVTSVYVGGTGRGARQ